MLLARNSALVKASVEKLSEVTPSEVTSEATPSTPSEVTLVEESSEKHSEVALGDESFQKQKPASEVTTDSVEKSSEVTTSAVTTLVEEFIENPSEFIPSEVTVLAILLPSFLALSAVASTAVWCGGCGSCSCSFHCVSSCCREQWLQ